MKRIGKVVLGTLGVMGGVMASAGIVFKIMKKTVTYKETKLKKFKQYYDMANQWLLLKNEGKSLEEYFKYNEFKSIAIYGMGEMGNRLYEELEKSNKVKIEYAIDENASMVYSELEVFSLEDKWKPVDAIIVTAVFDFENIQEELEKKTSATIVSLEDVVFEIN